MRISDSRTCPKRPMAREGTVLLLLRDRNVRNSVQWATKVMTSASVYGFSYGSKGRDLCGPLTVQSRTSHDTFSGGVPLARMHVTCITTVRNSNLLLLRKELVLEFLHTIVEVNSVSFLSAVMRTQHFFFEHG